MGNCCTDCWNWLRCRSKPAEENPGDEAFDDGDKEYGKFLKRDASQRNSPESQALLENATKFYDTAADYYSRTSDLNLGAALLNSASVRWHVYRFVKETDENNAARSENLLEEVIRLDDEALSLWKARQPKPPQYPTLIVNLAEAYRERFAKNKQTSDVQQAIQLYKSAREDTEKTTGAHAEAIKELGTTYWTWYNSVSNKDEHLQSAIRYLTDANRLAQQNRYLDIQYTCLYTLAWINHHRFDKQKEHNHTTQYLDHAIHFYRATLQSGMSQTDPRYAKALWFVPTLLFHRYERDSSVTVLEEAQTWAQDALNFPRITDKEWRKQLQAIRDFDSAASPETTRDARNVMRRTTMNSFRSSSDDYSIMPSATATMPTVFEADGAASHLAGEDEQEIYTDQFGISGSGAVTEEPLPLTTLRRQHSTPIEDHAPLESPR